ncbi:MAG: hypothetical protein ACI4WU_04805 [Bacilli bacterium]
MAGIIKYGQVYVGYTSDEHINEVIKSNIASTINSTSTKEELASAKDVYDDVISKHELKELKVNFGEPKDLTKIGISDYTTLTSLLEITKTLGTNYRLVMQVNGANKQTLFDNGIIPYNDSGLLIITVQSIRGSAIFTTDGNLTYVTTTSNAINTEWKAWQRVCTTTISDVSKTDLSTISTIPDSTYEIPPQSSFESWYYVQNGTCHVKIAVKTLTANDSEYTTVCEIPKSKETLAFYVDNWNKSPSGNKLAIMATTSGLLQVRNGTAGLTYWYSFSYPVKES